MNILLSKVALDLISAPASQAYTERLFSVCGVIQAGKRNRLASGLERRVFF
jgi:hAT family C-terminal dimerisation region